MGVAPTAGQIKTLDAPAFGYNFNIEIPQSDGSRIDSPAFRSALARLSPGVLRIPGGTIGDFWNWPLGGYDDALAEGLPERRFPPGPLGLTLNVVLPVVEQAGAEPHFTLNLFTRTLDENLADLAEAQRLGFRVDWVEVGNEQYFRSDANARAVFPTPTDYARTAAVWSAAVGDRFPDARVLAVGPAPGPSDVFGTTEWFNPLAQEDVWSTAEVAALHPYLGRGVVTLPTPTLADAEAMVSRWLMADAQLLSTFDALLPRGVGIAITEFGVFEDTANVRASGTWIQGLGQVARAMALLAGPRVELLLTHAVTGDPRWASLVGPRGQAYDYALGTPASGFLINGVPVWNLTGLGYCTALLNTAAKNAESAFRLDLGQGQNVPLFGMGFRRADGSQVSVFVNATTESLPIAAPGSRLTLVSAEPWNGVYRPDQIAVTRATSVTSFTLPSFSIAVLEGQGVAALDLDFLP